MPCFLQSTPLTTLPQVPAYNQHNSSTDVLLLDGRRIIVGLESFHGCVLTFHPLFPLLLRSPAASACLLACWLLVSPYYSGAAQALSCLQYLVRRVALPDCPLPDLILGRICRSQTLDCFLFSSSAALLLLLFCVIFLCG